MKKILIAVSAVLVIAAITQKVEAQVLIWTEGFESTLPNNLPSGWSYFDNTGQGIGPDTNWTVRDSGSIVPGVNTIRRSKARSGMRSAGVSWLTGANTSNSIADAWMVTKRINNVPGDALFSFWGTGGTPTFLDSLQLWISTSDSTPSAFLSNPNNLNQTVVFPPNPNYGQFEQIYIDLIPYAGQNIFIGFRYFMDVNIDGVFVQIDDVELLGTVGITQIGSQIPASYFLYQNFPNPFNPSTKINFDLPKSGAVRVVVYNNLGEEISELVNDYRTAGTYQIDFNGSSLSSGTYYYRMTTGSYSETRKMMIIK